MIKLGCTSMNLLKRCVIKYNPLLLSAIEDPIKDDYTSDFYNKLRDIVGEEFIQKGLLENDEPNEYGLVLEDLIDELGRFVLR